MAPIFLFLGALLIQDAIFIFKKKLYPPPTIRKYRQLLHQNVDEIQIDENDPFHKVISRWIMVQGYKSLLGGCFTIIAFTWLLFYALKN